MKIYKQETNKSCGVACLRSIVNFFGNNYSEKDIWAKHDYYGNKENLLSPILTLGVTAQKFGLKVKYYTYNPIIINNNKDSDLRKSLELKSKLNYDYGKYYVDKALEFLDFDGEIIVDKLGILKIKELIDENDFVLVEIRPALINKTSSINSIHKVVVIGYNDKGFKVLDPASAQEFLWDFESFLLAFYAAIPELLVIKK